jgi:signal transduction histidine kinase
VGDTAVVHGAERARRLGDRGQAPFTAAGRELLVKADLRALIRLAPGTLDQALDIVVDNTLQSVTVQVRPLGERPVVRIADQGAGIPDALLGRLFDRHLGSSAGSGIGLARTLVESDGGRLELIQARPATFELYLRAAERG